MFFALGFPGRLFCHFAIVVIVSERGKFFAVPDFVAAGFAVRVAAVAAVFTTGLHHVPDFGVIVGAVYFCDGDGLCGGLIVVFVRACVDCCRGDGGAKGERGFPVCILPLPVFGERYIAYGFTVFGYGYGFSGQTLRVCRLVYSNLDSGFLLRFFVVFFLPQGKFL